MTTYRIEVHNPDVAAFWPGSTGWVTYDEGLTYDEVLTVLAEPVVDANGEPHEGDIRIVAEALCTICDATFAADGPICPACQDSDAWRDGTCGCLPTE